MHPSSTGGAGPGAGSVSVNSGTHNNPCRNQPSSLLDGRQQQEHPKGTSPQPAPKLPEAKTRSHLRKAVVNALMALLHTTHAASAPTAPQQPPPFKPSCQQHCAPVATLVRTHPGAPPADDRQQAPWHKLLHADLLSSILHTAGIGPEVRLVCKQFREAYDERVARVTLRPSLQRTVSTHVARLQRGARRFRGLKAVALDASRLCLGAQGCSDVCAALGAVHTQRLPAPLHLDLGHNAIGPQGLTRFGAALLAAPASALSGLQALRLAGNELQSEGAALLAAALSGATWLVGLASLDLSDNGIGNSGMAKVAEALQAASHLASLEELSFAQNRFTAPGCVAVCSALQASKHMSRLSSLDLSGNDVASAPEGVAVLAAALRAPHVWGMQHLRLAECGIKDAGAGVLANALSAATQLRGLHTLSLASNAISAVGASSLAAALRASSHLSSLQDLPFGGNRHAEARSSHYGRQFVLTNGDAGAGASSPSLAPALISCTHFVHLTRLEVHDSCHAHGSCNNSLPRMAAALPAAHHLSGLRQLSIIIDSAVSFWMCALTSATQLAGLRSLELGLANADKHPSEVDSIARMLVSATHLRGLTQIDLSNTPLGKEAVPKVTSALAAATHLSSLQSLELDQQHSRGALKHVTALLLCAPHLSGLTALRLKHDGSLGDLRAAVAATSRLPALRSLTVEVAEAAPEGGCELATALKANTHLGKLRELVIIGCHKDHRLSKLARALRAAPHLSGLHRLAVLSGPPAAAPHHDQCATWCGGLGELAGALRECAHLSGLRELQLDRHTSGTLRSTDAIAYNGAAAGGVAAGGALDESGLLVASLRQARHLQGLRVVVQGVPGVAFSMIVDAQ